MILYLFFAMVLLSALVALGNWRRGLWLMLAVGVLQDPVRKLTPGTPSLLVLAFVPVWLAAVMNLYQRDKTVWSRFVKENRLVSNRMIFFAFTLVPAFFIVLEYGAVAWKVALIGAFGYLTPLVGILLGFAFANNFESLKRFLIFYCAITSVMMIGSVFEYLHMFPDWKIVGTSAMGMRWIRHISWGHWVELVAGFYRSPDIMGWHAATLVMIGLNLFMFYRSKLRWVWLSMAIWGGLCVLISGRNKMSLMPMVWTACMTMIYIYKGRGGRIFKIGVIAGAVVFGVLLASGKMSVKDDYLLNVKTASLGSFQRLDTHGRQAVWTTYQQSGFWGKGLGVASQGVQHLGFHAKGVWQEGGLDKIMVELGGLGLIAALLLVYALVLKWLSLIKESSPDSRIFSFYIGLLCMLAANGLCFVVSHQAYSDGLIMTLAAFLIGVVLSGTNMMRTEQMSAESKMAGSDPVIELAPVSR